MKTWKEIDQVKVFFFLLCFFACKGKPRINKALYHIHLTFPHQRGIKLSPIHFHIIFFHTFWLQHFTMMYNIFSSVSSMHFLFNFVYPVVFVFTPKPYITVPSALRMALPWQEFVSRTQATASSGKEALDTCQPEPGEQQPDGCGIRMPLPSREAGIQACWHCPESSEGQQAKPN